MERTITGASIAWGEGRIYDFENPNPEIITLEDAAFALAYTVRWRGQTRRWGKRCLYSVAEHCVFGAGQMLHYGHGAEHALAFLWHEADEIVLPDMPGPIKPCVPGFRELAKRQGDLILTRFGITIPDHDLVKRWDLRMLITEKRDLLGGHGDDQFHDSHHVSISEVEFPPFQEEISPVSHPDFAAINFINAHNALVNHLALVKDR